MMPESEMERLVNEHTQRILDAVAKHLETKAMHASFTSHDEGQTWLAAAREVRAIAKDAREGVAS